MASKNNRNNVKKTASTINSKWLSNTLKSMGVAGTQVIKDLMPATSETFSSTTRAVSDTINAVRSAGNSNKRMSDVLQKNPVIKVGQEFFKNAIEDIRTGNIYNTDREMGSDDDLNMDFDTIFEDIDDYYGDGESSGDVNINNNIVNNSDNGATLKALQQQTEYQVKSTKATVDTMVSIASTSIMHNTEIGNKVLSELSAINSNLAAIIEYNNTNMTKFIEASVGYYEQMASIKDDFSPAKEIKSENLFSSKGGLDVKTYAEYVKQNIGKLKDDSVAGSTIAMILENKDAFITNPLGEVTKGILKSAIPKVMQTSMEALDNSIKEVIPVLLDRIAEYGEQDTSTLGIGRMIGKIFGTRTDRKTKFDTSKIEKGPVPFNGMANHSIVEIIPKYLRESNAYLREIAESLTGKSNDQLKSSVQGFDWETGKFRDLNKMREDAYDQIYNSVVSAFSNSDFGKALSRKQTLLSGKDSDNYDKALASFYSAMERQEGNINFNDKNQLKEILKEVNGSDSIKNLIEATIEDMLQNNDYRIGNAYNAKKKATRDKASMMRMFEDSASENGLYQIDDSMSYDDYAIKKSSASVAGSVSVKSANVSVTSLLQGIQNTLNRGIYVVSKKSFDEPSSSGTSSIFLGNTIQSNTSEANVAKSEGTTSKEEFLKKLNEEREEETLATIDSSQYRGVNKVAAGAANKMNALAKVFNGIVTGNADKAWDEFISGIGDVFKKASGFLSEHFFAPMKKELFGEKDADGYIKGGLFSGVNNRMKESFYGLRRMITGKGYTDAEGNQIADATDEEKKETVVGKLKGMLTSVKEGISLKLFGEKDPETGETTKEGLTGKLKGSLQNASESFMEGLHGWKVALFGEKDSEKDSKTSIKETWENVKDKASKVLPNALFGSIVGATGGMLSGGLLGTLVGGPIGGALLGFAGGIASKSEKFQNFLFGEKDKDGNRMGGLISKKVQDYFKKNGKLLAGGAGLGLISGTITGGGLLGMLVGGPIAGALMGIGSTMLTKSEMFKKFIFGDEKSGQLGLIKTVKSMFGKFHRGAESKLSLGGKLAGMLGIGAGVGAISIGALTNSGILGLALGPAGPIGGALLGVGAAMLAQKDNFKEWLFGKTNEDGTKKEGILGQFKNMLTANVFRPLGNNFKAIGRDFKTFLQYDVLNKFNLIIEPMGKAIFGSLSKIAGKSIESISQFGNFIKEDFLKGFIDKTRDVLSPLTTAVGTMAKGIYGVTKKVIAAPINILYTLTSPVITAVTSGIANVAKGAFKVMDYVLVKPIKTLVVKPLFGLVKVATDVVLAPFKVLGKVTDFITDKVKSGVDHIGKFTRMIGRDFKNLLLNNPIANWFKKKGNQLKNFGERIKETVSIVMSPVTDFVKSALAEVKNQVKQGLKTFFKGAFGVLTWLPRKLFAGARWLLGGRKGKKDNKERTGLFGYLANAWRETGSEDYVEDFTDGGINDLSYSDRRKANKISKKNELERNRKLRRQDKLREYNERLIAKATNNQRVEDTEENRKLATAMSKRKLKFKNIETKDSVEKKVQVKAQEAQVEATKAVGSEVRETNRLVGKILHSLGVWMFGSKEEKRKLRRDAGFLSGKQNKEKATIYDDIKTAADSQEFAEKVARQKTGSGYKTADSKDRKKADKAIHAERAKQFGDNYEKHGFFGGIRQNWISLKNQISAGVDTVNQRYANTEDIERHEKGTLGAKPGPAIVGEAGPEVMYGKNSKYGRFVGVNGPEVVNMKGGETVIPNNRIAKYADGTDNIAKSDKTDSNLLKEKDSTKLSLSERMLRELISLKNEFKISASPNLALADGADIPDDYDTTNIDKIKGGIRNIGRRMLRRIPGYGLASGLYRGTKTALGAIGESGRIVKSKLDSKIGKIKDSVLAAGALVESKFHDREEEENQAKIAEVEGTPGGKLDVHSLTGERMRAEKAAKDEEESDDKREDAKLAAALSSNKEQKEHNKTWDSIFSKKGLITGGILTFLPLITKFLKSGVFKNILTVLSSLGSGLADIALHVGKIAFKVLGDTVKNTAEDLEFAQDGGLGDGKDSGEKLKDEANRGVDILTDIVEGNPIDAVKTFLFDENGNANHETGSRAKLLSKKGAKVGAKLIEGGSLLKTKAGNVVSKVQSKIGAKNVTKAAKTTTKKTVAKVSKKASRKARRLARKSAKKVATSVADNAVDTAAKVAKSSTDDVVKSARGGAMTKLVGHVKTLFSKVAQKVGKKTGKKVGPTVFSKLLSKVTKCLSSSAALKKFGGKVAALVSSTAALGATVIGLAAKEVTWVVLGAVGGATGAKRLFRTDDVDPIMIAISTALGAFNGTTVGAFCDVANEIVASILGIDIYTELATALYSFIMRLAGKDDKADKLRADQKDFQERYDKDRAKSLKKQYKTMQKAGLLDKNVSEEDYIKGAKDGKYSAKIQSFSDYNAEKHKTIWGKMGSGLSKGGKAVGKFFKEGGEAWFGKKDKFYQDSNGNIYRDNGDGTYQVTSSDGKDLGFVSKDALPKDAKKKTVKKDGLVQIAGKKIAEGGKAVGKWASKTATKIGNAAKAYAKDFTDFYISRKEKVWYDGNGCYYKAEGNKFNYYNGNGSRIGGPITVQELDAMAKQGLLTEGEIQVDSGLKKEMKRIGKKLKQGWDSVIKKATDVKDKVMKKASDVADKAKKFGAKVKNYFTAHTEKRWHSTEGGYYQSADGNTFKYYNDNGDLLDDNISAAEFENLCKAGIVTATDAEEVKAESGIKEGLTNLGKKAGKAFKNLLKKGGELWNKAVSKTNELFKNSIGYKIGTKLGTKLGKFLKKQKAIVWYDTDGNYYKAEGSTYTKYNMNGDILEENIDKTQINEMATTGLLTQGTIETDSEAQNAIKDIKKAVKEAWKSAKTTVTSGWSKFKDWITGGGGTGASLQNVVNSKKGSSISVGGYGSGVIQGGRGDDTPQTLNGSTYYSQNDSRWANSKFVQSNGKDDGATMANTGCGPTAMSMVINDITKKNPSPTELARYAQFSGTRDNTGTNWNFIDSAASTYGIDSVRNMNPSEESIRAGLANGTPMILSGQDDGSGTSPYTKSGHYVVAVGTDGSGNIIINDPRGKSYSGKKNMRDVLRGTSASWTFSKESGGAFGKGLKQAGKVIKKLIKGGRGNGVTANDVVKVAMNEIGYLEKASNSNLDSKTGNAGTRNYTKYARDIGHTNGLYWCATFVCWCIYVAANRNKKIAKDLLCGNFSAACTSLMNAFKSKGRFFTSNPQPGDLIFFNYGRHGGADHIGIVASVSGGNVTTVEGNASAKSTTTNGGGVASHTFPATKSSILGYGRPLYDGTSNFKGDLGGSTSTDASASENQSIFDMTSSMYSSLANAAFNGILSGNLNRNWDEVFSDGSTQSSDSGSFSTSSITTTANIKGSNNAEKVWNYLIGKGLTKAGAAGLMGNLHAESGINPRNLQNSYERKLGMSDDAYTNAVNSGSYTNFANDSAGYGLAQWTSAGRKKGLYNLSKSSNRKIDDITLQLDWLWHELSKSYSKVLSVLKTASDVKTASNAVLHKFEAPRDQSAAVENKRASFGNGYYKQYGGSGEGPTIQNKRYVGSESKSFSGGRGDIDVTPIQKSIVSNIGNKDNQVTRLSNTNINVDNTNLEQLMMQMVELLGNISASSKNLDLLRDIKTGIRNTNIVNNKTTNNITNGKKRTTTQQSSTTMSDNERTARQIAFSR